jgi:hypothetical protein
MRSIVTVNMALRSPAGRRGNLIARPATRTFRPAVGTAIRWPRATHRLGSLLASAEEGIHHVLGTTNPHPSGTAHRSDIAKGHGRTLGRRAQKLRLQHPSTTTGQVKRWMTDLQEYVAGEENVARIRVD